MVRKIALCWGVFILAACVATGPIFTEVKNVDSSLATIYLYHPKDAQYQYVYEEANFLFYNGQKVFRFIHGGYTYFLVQPGDHIFEIRWSFFGWPSHGRGTVTINAEAGKTYYVKYQEELEGRRWNAGTGNWDPTTRTNIGKVEESQGKMEISAMRYLDHELHMHSK